MPRELWRSALPGRRRRTGSPFFRRPGRVPATFTLVGSMAGTRIFAPMVRPSRNAVDGRPVAPFPDRRLNRRQTVVHLP